MTGKSSEAGNTLTEYGLAIALIALLGFTGLKVLGGSVSETLGSVKQNEAPLMRMASLDFGGTGTAPSMTVAQGNVPLTGKGYYTLAIDPATGIPSLKATDGGGSTATNATSIEGDQWNTLGGFHIADSLEELAKAQTDPAAQDYLMQMAKTAYYLGAAEGELDGVQGFEFPDDYTNLHAYRDVLKFQSELKSLMSKPPAGIDPALLREAMPLAVDVYNIAQTYSNSLAPIVSQYPNQNFGTNALGANHNFGSGTPGSMLEAADKLVAELDTRADLNNKLSYTQIMSFTQLKNTAQQLLAANNLDSEPVKATFTDAEMIEGAAATSALPSSP